MAQAPENSSNSKKLLDGKAVAAKLKESVKKQASEFESQKGRKAKLVVVLVGTDPASQVYVGNKVKACNANGIESELLKFPEDISESDLLSKLEALNADGGVDGILVQLPLPKHIDAHKVADKIDPLKDADCLSAINQGLLYRGQARVSPCTPYGVIHLLKNYDIAIEGKKAVVLGRSEIVGKPMVHLLLQENASVTWLHSRSKNTEEELKSADIVIVAVGKPKLFKANQFKKGSVVIDVGVHREASGLCGDVDHNGLAEQVSFYTPVPGGVGPLTIAMLLQNTLKLASLRNS